MASRRSIRSSSGRRSTSASTPSEIAEGGAVLAALADGLGRLGLNVLLPVAPAVFDGACAAAHLPAPLRLTDFLPVARGAVVVGSGGPAFFDRFERLERVERLARARDGTGPADPLDRYTRRVVTAAVAELLGARGIAYALGFPFGGEPLIPFQRLGRAAGLGDPGPLGLQIHPSFGPWWAYRALVVVDRALPAAPALGDGCAGCAAPCVPACPAGAVRRPQGSIGFSISACQARRRVAEPCRLSCAARIACVRGPEHRYRDEELAFHMAASLPKPAPG